MINASTRSGDVSRDCTASILTVALVGMAVACAASVAVADDGAIQTSWPEFRGPWGNGLAAPPGVASEMQLPLHWSETEHVTWKTEIPFRGWSTPVVAGTDIWVTTATEDGHDFYALCVDLDTGAIRLNKLLFHSDTPESLGNNVNRYASPSPVIKNGRVYVHFGSYGTACLDTATGDLLWKRNDLPCRHYRGPGSSPILFEDLLVLTFDGVDRQYVTALNAATGETVWKTDRSTVWTDLDESGQPKREGDFRKAFSTPLIIDAGGTLQMISVGSSTAFAYDPRTGAEIWKLRLPGYTPAARPVFGHGLAYICSGRGSDPELIAVRVDGQGDVTDSHAAWRAYGPDIPQEPSPILVEDLLYTVSNRGVVTCYEAMTGTQVWQERIGGNFVTSPVHAGNRLYLCSTQGKTTIIRTGRTFETLAENELEEGFMASPAVAGNTLILRTRAHVYRIEEP